jgi:hypothetical protein
MHTRSTVQKNVLGLKAEHVSQGRCAETVSNFDERSPHCRSFEL